MFRVGVCVLIAAAALGVAALAFGQEIVPIKITAKVEVTPNKAGTPAHPQGVKIHGKVTVDIPHDFDPPLVKTVDVWISKGGRYNGGKWPTCSEATLSHRGPKGCPPRSIMGKGSAVAEADTSKTYPQITIVNGGPTKVYFYVVLTSPARVQQPVLATVTKLPASSRWGYHVHSEIPRNLQIVAGIPLRLNSIEATAGRGDWIATTSCPKGNKWSYHAETSYSSGQVVKTDGGVPCRR
jgi:hypothetical protein